MRNYVASISGNNVTCNGIAERTHFKPRRHSSQIAFNRTTKEFSQAKDEEGPQARTHSILYSHKSKVELAKHSLHASIDICKK